MVETVMGMCGLTLGLVLWGTGYWWGRRQLPEERQLPELTLQEQRAIEKARQERYNFLNFEGDEMKEQR